MSPLDERLARVALGRIGEPGDPRLAGLVAELGAAAIHEALRRGARRRRPAHRRRHPAAGRRPERELAGRPAGASGS